MIPVKRFPVAVFSFLLPSILSLVTFLVTVAGQDCAFAATPAPLQENIDSLLAKGEYERALEQLEKTYNLFPLDPVVKGNLAITYGLLGGRQLERKQFDEAAVSFDRARALEPDNPEYHLGRGIALYGGKHYDDARFSLEQARLFGGDTVTVLFFLGKVCYDTGNLDGALDYWRKGLAVDPDNAELTRLVAKTVREAAVEGRMGKESSSRFDISYDVKTESRLADDILDILETAYSRVGSDFDYYPDARIPVIVYTKQDFRATTAGPDWSGGIYDGKIRLPIGGIREVSPQLKAVLHHEYTHVVVRELTKGNCPTWLNEGLAQVEEQKEADIPLDAVTKAAQQGTLLPMTTLEAPFLSLGAKDARLAYQQSYAMTKQLIAVYGWHKVKEILVNLGQRMSFGEAVTKAMKDYGIGNDEVLQGLLEYLKKDYGSG